MTAAKGRPPKGLRLSLDTDRQRETTQENMPSFHDITQPGFLERGVWVYECLGRGAQLVAAVVPSALD